MAWGEGFVTLDLNILTYLKFASLNCFQKTIKWLVFFCIQIINSCNPDHKGKLFC